MKHRFLDSPISLLCFVSRCSLLALFSMGWAVTAYSADHQASPSRPPNIVLLFADDAGYSDFGFQGSETIKTPHLDKLASQGMRFTSAYVTESVCGPSRAGLLTGLYQQRFGFEENNVPGIMSPAGLQGDDMGLPLDRRTIANYLKPLGYRSIILGKWHQGVADRYHPLKRGFDEFYGFRGGARSYFPYGEGEGRFSDQLEQGFRNYVEHEGYLTDDLADKACDFIDRHQDQPFFLFLSFNAVHTPMHATQEDLLAFPNLKGKRRELAAMTLAMDRACGKVLDQLEALSLEDNTLVVFTNDNGGPSYGNASRNDPLSGTKAAHLEGGIRVPFILRWPGKVPAQAEYLHPISTLDLLPTFVSAAGGKGSLSEGLDGVDLLPYLKNPDGSRPHETLYWKREMRGAIRDMDWKLIRLPDRPAELYNLAEDPSERRNLADLYPDKVKALYKKLFAWEMELERPLWLIKRSVEKTNAERYDQYRQ